MENDDRIAKPPAAGLNSRVNKDGDAAVKKDDKPKEKKNALFGDDDLTVFDDGDEGEAEEDVRGARKLLNPSAALRERIASDIHTQLSENQGEVLYEIGVDEDGTVVGLTDEELATSIANLKEILAAGAEKAHVFPLATRHGKKGKVADLLLRQERPHHYIDVRLAVCGNVDAGKSTMIGVLTRGKLDDGRGLLRSEVFLHKHETGRTSAISHQIVGFGVSGECVNSEETADRRQLTWGDIIAKSYKVVSFFDLAGHEKYLKTTVAGMTGQMPDYALLLIGANMGVTKMTKEHLGLALALKVPIVVLITKVDICPPNILEETLTEIQKILKSRGVRKIPLLIKGEEDVVTALKNITADRMVPIFQVSSVTGAHLELLRKLLNAMPPRLQWDRLRLNPCEILIDTTYHVTGVGTVVSGTVMAGQVSTNDTMLLGPDGNGQFIPVGIKSIHCKRVAVETAYAGQSASLALKKVKRSQLRRGMVLVATTEEPKATWTFEAEVVILYHSTTVQIGYQPVVQCMAVRQSAKIIQIIDREVLRTGDRATVRFRFMYHPEFLKIGMRMVIREGQCKGIGILSRLVPEDSADAHPTRHPHQKSQPASFTPTSSAAETGTKK